MRVERDALVEFHYRLYDEEGELVEATEPDEPIRAVHGDEMLLPGIERALEGAEAGATLRFTLEPDDAFGAYNPEGIVSVPRKELPPEHEYLVGDWISIVVEDRAEAEDEGDGDEEGEMEMRILEVRDEDIVFDANHPLAGQRITFEVDVVSVTRNA